MGNPRGSLFDWRKRVIARDAEIRGNKRSFIRRDASLGDSFNLRPKATCRRVRLNIPTGVSDQERAEIYRFESQFRGPAFPGKLKLNTALSGIRGKFLAGRGSEFLSGHRNFPSRLGQNNPPYK